MSEEVLGGEPRRTVKWRNVRIVSPMFWYVLPGGPGSTQKADGAPAVSYTHLTLPTIYSV